MSPKVTQWNAHSSTYEAFLPKRLSPKLIKPLDVTTSSWEIPGTEKQVKAQHMAAIGQIQTSEFYRTNEPVSSTNKWQEKKKREEELVL